MERMDSDLLKAFLTVVDAGGFTRAADRLARTQSTISQQIRRLEEELGQTLLLRHPAGRNVLLTPAGELLIGYARKLLEISEEARSIVSSAKKNAVVRLGITEDLSLRSLTTILRSCRAALPAITLHVTSAWGDALKTLHSAGEFDLIVAKQASHLPGLAARSERAIWVASPEIDAGQDPVPLVVFPLGCLYRSYGTAALEGVGRAWRIAFTGQGVAAVQAAVSAGIGVAILPEDITPPRMRRLRASEGFPPIPSVDLALIGSAPLSLPARRVADHLEEILFRRKAGVA